MNLDEYRAAIVIARNGHRGNWAVRIDDLDAMINLIDRQESELRADVQALADKDLALMEQTTLTEKCRQQAETKDAETTLLRAQVEDLQARLAQGAAGIDLAELKRYSASENIEPNGDYFLYDDLVALLAAPQQHAQAAQQTGTRKIGVTEDGLAALSSAGHAPLSLTDEQVIGVLHSCGIDTYPSVNGFASLQVSATSITWVREVVRRCMVIIETADSRVTGDAQAALSDAVKALPHFHREGVENGGYVLTSDVLRILATSQPAPDDLIGLAVSVDVSTGDDDATHRYFGKVDAVQECASEKGGIILLVQEPKPNFSAPVAAAVQGEADVAFAQFCDREGYPSDGPFDAALRKAFDAGRAAQPPADAAPADRQWSDEHGDHTHGKLPPMKVMFDASAAVPIPAVGDGLAPKASKGAVPAGWQIVPKEPTPEMLAHVDNAVPDCFSIGDEYRAMLAAAPSPAQAQPVADAAPVVAVGVEQSLAQKDADLCGVGYLVDGKRVAPEWVTVVLPAPPAPHVERDAARLDFIENCTVDLRCYSPQMPGCDDADVYWNVIEHHMADPSEREIGWGNNAREAIDAAMAAQQNKKD